MAENSPKPADSLERIEITPEMIKAGVSSFSLYCGAFCDSSFFSEALVVSEVYSAMRRLEGYPPNAEVIKRRLA